MRLGVSSIAIPYSVTSIGEGSFWQCRGLTSITIPSSVTSIGIGAFGQCCGLTSITIPSSVTYIGDEAFAECYSLTTIFNRRDIPQDIINVFWGLNRTTCTLFVPIGSIEAYRAAEGWKDFVNINEIQ